ncbi:MAG TPA: 5-formyltetrahydrofolate cyclo-ligase [Methylophaga sp.]|nr:5-formyltetrahydrofolate cyclo-ligase [Methylophaga sp.]
MPESPDWVTWRQVQRQQLIASRQSLTETERFAAEQQIHTRLLSLLAPLPASIISFYMPIKGELNCQPLIEDLLDLGWHAALPKIIAKDTALQFRQWTPDTEMQPEIWQIPVPQNTAELVPNVLLIPLVGFDHQRHRLGNGGGFYDRSLASILPSPLAIGVGLESLKLVDIQPQPHDIAMNYVVTEQAIYPHAVSRGAE